jgi:hypothetical protein
MNRNRFQVWDSEFKLTQKLKEVLSRVPWLRGWHVDSAADRSGRLGSGGAHSAADGRDGGSIYRMQNEFSARSIPEHRPQAMPDGPFQERRARAGHAVRIAANDRVVPGKRLGLVRSGRQVQPRCSWPVVDPAFGRRAGPPSAECGESGHARIRTGGPCAPGAGERRTALDAARIDFSFHRP